MWMPGRLVTMTVLAAVTLASPAVSAVEREVRPSAEQPAVASSTVKVNTATTYGPEKVMDGRFDTSWCEGVEGDGVGQWVAFYLGKGSNLGGPQDFELWINRGYQKDYEMYVANGRPTKVRVELFDDWTLLASTEAAVENTLSLVALTGVPAGKGALWGRVTMLAVQTGAVDKDTCIAELRPSFGKANPSNVREFAARVCQIINKPGVKETNRELLDLVKKVRKYFHIGVEDGGEPHCSVESLKVLSDTDFELQGSEEGDGATCLRFRKAGIVWDLLSVSSFSLFD